MRTESVYASGFPFYDQETAMTKNEMTFAVQCRSCNEDIVFRSPAKISANRLITKSNQLRCPHCSVEHVYQPNEFVVCELDPV
jgi:cytochrome c-type biogenesis protein CcmH/NrfF